MKLILKVFTPENKFEKTELANKDSSKTFIEFYMALLSFGYKIFYKNKQNWRKFYKGKSKIAKLTGISSQENNNDEMTFMSSSLK